MKKRIIGWVESNGKIRDFFSIFINIIVGMIVSALVFSSSYRVPATSNDYIPLEQQIVAIQMDHNQIFKKDCDINVKNKLITITLENTECKVSGKFDSDFNLQELKRTDKASSLLGILGSLLLSLITYVVIFIAFYVLMNLILDLFIWFVKKMIDKFKIKKE